MAKIKKISIGDNTLDVCDAEATHTINGYSSADVEAQTVTFANEPITKEEIIALFTAKEGE